MDLGRNAENSECCLNHSLIDLLCLKCCINGMYSNDISNKVGYPMSRNSHFGMQQLSPEEQKQARVTELKVKFVFPSF
jgi:hypothetical protein